MNDKGNPGASGTGARQKSDYESGRDTQTLPSPQATRDRPTYVLRLQSQRGDNDIRLLRWALKVLLRRFGWRAVSVEEERP
jgi:hypothetical protein